MSGALCGKPLCVALFVLVVVIRCCYIFCNLWVGALCGNPLCVALFVLVVVIRCCYIFCNLWVGALCGNPQCVALFVLVGVSGEETSFLLFSEGTKKDVSIFLLSFSFFLLSLLSFLVSRSLSVDVSGVSSDVGGGGGGGLPLRSRGSPPPRYR